MDSYFRITSYGLIATAAFALAITGGVDLVSVAFYGVVLAVCFWRDLRRSTRFRLREWMWRVMAILYVPFVFIDGAFISNRVLALVHMTLILSAAKLFQEKRDRDWVFLYLIGFFQMLLAAGLTFNASFVASLTLFLFFFISTLAAFEIRRARREMAQTQEMVIVRQKQNRSGRRSRAGESRGEPSVRYFVAASAGQIAVVAILTLPLFFLIPRFGGGGLARGYGNEQAITGFSEKVELGQFASIKKSPRVVMRVRLDHSPQRYIRWRGIALENYDGRAWTLSPELKDRQSAMIAGSLSTTEADTRIANVYIPVNRTGTQMPLGQGIILEPLSTPVLFAAGRPVSLRIAAAGATTDKYTGEIRASGLRGGRVQYSVTSDIWTPTEDQLRADSASEPGYKETINHIYTQIPRNLDTRIVHLAREKTKNEQNAYDKARAIESYLKSNFRYTLDLKPANVDPLAEFLFDLKEGHCEYFATAMVIMLRSLNIPARIVNGFQMGEYNELNNYYTVRESDAHSWVEVYFPHNDAWIEFDPTPSSGINDYSKGGIAARLRKYADAMEIFWLDYVVTLDRDEQASMMVELQHRLVGLKETAQAYYQSARNFMKGAINQLKLGRKWELIDLFALLALAFLLGAGVLAGYIALARRQSKTISVNGYGPWWYRIFVLPFWKRMARSADNRQSAVLFYERMLAVMRRAGLVKAASQTPVEFARMSGLTEVGEITTYYNRVRFGGEPLDEGEALRITWLIEELKRSMRTRKR